MAFGKDKAMHKAIRMHIDRANDRSQGRQMVKNNTVNPNKMGPGRKEAIGRQVRPLPGLSGANIAKRPGFAPIRRPKPRPIRKPGFGPGSGRTGPGPR